MARFLVFLLKTLIPLGILAGGALFAKYLLETGPEPQKRPPVDRTPVVEANDFLATDYTVKVNASGVVKARTQSNIVTEVSGKIIEVSENFNPGAYVEKGETLLVLDETDYVDQINIANSNIAANEAALAQLDQEEQNTLTNLKLAQESLQTAQQNLRIAQQNINNVQRKAAPISKNTELIKRNINLARQTFNITKQNLQLAKGDLGLVQKNLALAQKELGRVKELGQRKLLPASQVDSQEQAVLQQQQQVSAQRQKILQLEQSLVQQQQAIVQQEQQLTQQDQSVAQQDQNVLGQQQQILQQQQAVNQQKQNIANLEGQLATFEARRNSLIAKIDLTQNQLLQQQRNLARTKITAPYTGRILEKRADVGQFLSPNATVGVIYATDYVEVEMPLTLAQYGMLSVPSQEFTNNDDLTSLPSALFRKPFDPDDNQWTGFITGTRASLNEQSRQIIVVARINNPFGFGDSPGSSLNIGQYLNAEIEGRTFENVYILPPAAVRQNRDILQLKEKSVHVVPIKVVLSNEDEIVVTSDEDLGSAPIITTPLGQASEGMKVALPGEKKKTERGKQRGNGESNKGGSEKTDEQAAADTKPDQESAADTTEKPQQKRNANQSEEN